MQAGVASLSGWSCRMLLWGPPGVVLALYALRFCAVRPGGPCMEASSRLGGSPQGVNVESQ